MIAIDIIRVIFALSGVDVINFPNFEYDSQSAQNFFYGALSLLYVLITPFIGLFYFFFPFT